MAPPSLSLSLSLSLSPSPCLHLSSSLALFLSFFLSFSLYVSSLSIILSFYLSISLSLFLSFSFALPFLCVLSPNSGTGEHSMACLLRLVGWGANNEWPCWTQVTKPDRVATPFQSCLVRSGQPEVQKSPKNEGETERGFVNSAVGIPHTGFKCISESFLVCVSKLPCCLVLQH